MSFRKKEANEVYDLFLSRNNDNQRTPLLASAKDAKQKKRRLFIIFVVLALVLITTLTIVIFMVFKNNNTELTQPENTNTMQPTFEPTTEPTTEPTMEPTMEPTIDIIWNELPKPGIPYIFETENNITQNITLNTNASYFHPDTIIECIIEFDEDGNLDSNISYIKLFDDYRFVHTIKLDMILISASPLFEFLPINCTIVSAV
eukprot:297106_1